MAGIRRKRTNDGRFDLQDGPYQSPKVRRGGKLFCENYGTVEVYKFSDGPIPWPLHLPGKGGRAFILCGDLVRAVRREAAGAVARAWGVKRTTVWRWRRILGVEQFNIGTHNLFLKYQGKGLTPEAIARGWAARTAQQDVEWGRQRREKGQTRQRQWTPKEDKLLGKIPDTDVARKLRSSASTVARRRKDLGIPCCPDVIRGSHTRHMLQYSAAKLQARRLELGLFQTEVSVRCGWRPTAYQRLETGRTDRITSRILARVAKALRCEVTDLLVDSDPSES